MKGFSVDQESLEIKLEESFLSYPTPEIFRKHLKKLTKEPHTAGSPGGEAVIKYITEVMSREGWIVQQYPYDVYLTPEPTENKLEILEPEFIPLANQERKIPGDLFSSNEAASWGWNAYSGSGDVSGEVVYANRATKQDFDSLASWNISVKGKIVIARYGGNFRGYKAKYAEAAGAAGLILYSDPQDNGYTRGLEYPEGAFGNATCIQRGSLLTLDFTGDPLTPFEPALPRDTNPEVIRTDPSEVAFHTIPVSPIPYGSARAILSKMRGPAVSRKNWQGGLPFTYRLTGGDSLKIRLNVQLEKKFVRCTNVVGTLRGTEYPDEWIIIGCHHDAWAFGAIDPSSGSAVLLSLAESLGKLAAQGYRPKRSIMLAHWDAEEHGIIGSTEWVEQMREELDAKAVAYLNADAAVSGPNFGVASSPSLKGLIREVSRRVPYGTGEKTLYEHWAQRYANLDVPPIGNLGGGSDHVGFYTHIGVPSLSAGISGANGVYHSLYDNFAWYSRFGDKDFIYGPTMEKFLGLLSLRLANAELIPYDIASYPNDLQKHLRRALDQIQKYAPEYKASSLEYEISNMKLAAEEWENRFSGWLRSNPSKEDLMAVNEQLIQLEKAFIDKKGMRYGSWYRSLYASPDPYSGYASWMLPGLLYEASLNETKYLEEMEARYLKAFSTLTQNIKNTTLLMK